MTETPATPVDEIRPGDILFFAPPVLEPWDVANFAQLAALVQSIPYGKPEPWHHVAIAAPAAEGSGVDVIGFEMVSDAAGSPWESVLELTPWDVATAGSAVTALRLPGVGDTIAGAAEEMARVKARYSTLALLAFAAAIQGSLFREGLARRRLFDYAAGIQVLPVEEALRGYTCVTATAEALEVAGVTLTVEEPPVPPAEVRPALETLLALVGRVEAGGLALQLEPPGESANELLSEDQIHQGYSATPFIVMVPDPGITTTWQYLQLLESSIRTLAGLDVSTSEIIALGEEARAGRRWPTPMSWATSPAMFRDALLQAGAEEIL